jgi:hypothetical protein
MGSSDCGLLWGNIPQKSLGKAWKLSSEQLRTSWVLKQLCPKCDGDEFLKSQGIYQFVYSTNLFLGSRDSSVGLATGYRLGDRGVGVRVALGVRIFSSPCPPDRFWGPPSLLSNGYLGSFPGGKADHSLPTSAEVKKTWIYTSIRPYVFMA